MEYIIMFNRIGTHIDSNPNSFSFYINYLDTHKHGIKKCNMSESRIKKDNIFYFECLNSIIINIELTRKIITRYYLDMYLKNECSVSTLLDITILYTTQPLNYITLSNRMELI